MQSRRHFIKITAGALAVGASGLALPKFSFALTGQDIPGPGVQLFTFFNVIDNDVQGTLKKVAETGVKNIESAFSKKGDYYGMPAKDFSALLKNLGMTWRSHHVFGAPIKLPAGMPSMKNLKENLNEILDDAVAGGLNYLVAAHLPISTNDDIKASLNILNRCAPACKQAGIQLIYHNEPADFKNIGGAIPYEIFLTETDPDALKFELDIAWAVKAGQDPLKLFGRYPGRFPLWHVKDLDSTFEKVLPIGDGALDYKKYFQNAAAAGLKYYFIEHEAAPDPFASIAASIADIKKIV